MTQEEQQQPRPPAAPDCISRKRPFHVAFEPTQVILDALPPQVSTYLHAATRYWLKLVQPVAAFISQRIASVAAPHDTTRTQKKKKKKRREEEGTVEERAARRALRRKARLTADAHSYDRDVIEEPSQIAATTTTTQIAQHGQAHTRIRKSLYRQYARAIESRERLSLTDARTYHGATASPVYRGMFAESRRLQGSVRSSPVLGLRTARDAKHLLIQITPFKSRIAKASTLSKPAQYLASPAQASPEHGFRSPGAPRRSPAPSFNPFKTKHQDNKIRHAASEEQSLEELIAELRREHPHQYEWQKIDREKEARNLEIAKKRGLHAPVREPLPVATVKRVEMALHGHTPHDTVLVERFNQEIRVKDLSTLKSTAWLNDEVINFYMNLIVERAKPTSIKLHAFNTFFYPKLVQHGYKDVRRWAKKAKVDVSQCDLVLVPVHLGVHWCMSVINFRNRRFEYWDSLQGGAGQAFTALREYVKHEAPSIDASTWPDWVSDSGPRQRNGYDCGVFACQTAECVSRFAEPQFTQDDMPELRRRMAVSILDAKIY